MFYGAKELLILAWLTWYESSDLIIILMSQPYYEGLGLLLFLVEVRVLQLSLVEQITSKSPSFRAAFKEIIFVQYCFFLLHDGGRCSKWKCLSSGTFNSLPVCLLMIFFCWAMCKTIVVSSKFILLLQPLQLVASLNSAGFCAYYAHLSHLLALPVLFDR